MSKLEPCFLDTETTSFHGIIVLMQAAIGDGPIQLWSPWTETATDTLDWMRKYVLHKGGLVMFNASFDFFHCQKLYNVLTLFQRKYGKHEFPEDYVNEIAALEKDARFENCIKPYGALDLMLHSKKGEFQSLMNRKAIRIRRIPYIIALDLVDELNRRIVLDDVYFARKADKTTRWKIHDITNDLGEVIPDLVDVVLTFAPSGSLKALAIHVGIQNANTRSLFEDVSIPEQFMSNEPGYSPFATAPFELPSGKFVVPSPSNWYGRWPEHIRHHIHHWTYNEDARIYAEDDIKDTRGLYKYFGCPDLGDDDSELACMVGSTRWRGFSIDRVSLEKQLNQAEEDLKQYDFNWNSPNVCRKVLEQHMDDDLKKLIPSTSKNILEEVAKWQIEDVCDDCFGAGCEKCENKGTVSTGVPHLAALDAERILQARRTSKRRGDILKLMMTDRFHPDFKIIGAKSSRMSGTGGLNAQGISSAPAIRSCFTLADSGEILSGGDFDSFEVTIADATYNDPALRADLLADTKLHAVMGGYLYDLTYEETMSTKGLEGNKDKYAKGKSAIFALFYGGDSGTLVRKSGVSLEKAQEAEHKWAKRYPVMNEGKKKVIDAHTCMTQPKGIGSNVIWKEPAEYVETMFGFRRYFTLENKICKALFDLATNPPKDWKSIKGQVVRRDKTQTSLGATRSALYGAAFNIMSSNIRASINHLIQGSGATPQKSLQRQLWDIQPSGESKMLIRGYSVHDELLMVHVPEVTEEVIKIKDSFLVEFRKRIPLLAITWITGMSSWQNTH